MQDTEMSDVEKFAMHEEYYSIPEFNQLSSFSSENNFSSIHDDLPLSNNFGYYNDPILGTINTHDADDKEIQLELGFSLLDENILDPLLNLEASNVLPSYNDSASIPQEILENTESRSLKVEVSKVNKNKKSRKKSRHKFKGSKNDRNSDKSEAFLMKNKSSCSQATVTFSADVSESNSDKVDPIPKMIIKLTPRKPQVTPVTPTNYFALTIADKVKMGRRRQSSKLTDTKSSNINTNCEKVQKKTRKMQKKSSTDDEDKSCRKSDCFKSIEMCETKNGKGNHFSCRTMNTTLERNSDLCVPLQDLNVAVKQIVYKDVPPSCSYNTKFNSEEIIAEIKNKPLEIQQMVTLEKDIDAPQSWNEILIKKELATPQDNKKQRHVDEKLNKLQIKAKPFANFDSVQSCIAFIKEEPMDDESNLFSEHFDQDVKNFITTQMDLTDELEKAIFDEETKRASMSEFDLESINANLNSELFDNDVHCKNDSVKTMNDIYSDKTSLNLSQESSTYVGIDISALNSVQSNVSSADAIFESKAVFDPDLQSSSIGSEIILETIEVSTPELELQLCEPVHSSDLVIPLNTKQVLYSSENLNATERPDKMRTLKVNKFLKKEAFHPTGIHSYETESSLHLPSVPRRRKLSSCSSTGSISSYSYYSSSELPNSSSSPNSCFSPGKRQKTSSKSRNYDRKQSSKCFKVDASLCTSYENDNRNSKFSLPRTLATEDTSRQRNDSGSSSSSQSRSPHTKDRDCYRSQSKSFSRDRKRSSRSRSKSPSHFQKYKPSSKFNRSSSNTHRYQIDHRENFEAIEERRVLYVGDIPLGYTVKMLRERFSRFGPIEDVQIKSKITNCVQKTFGFVTFKRKCDAYQAIEKGNDNPLAPKFDLNFGGRRRFCNGDYTDLDGKVAEVESGWYDYRPKPTAKDDDVFAKLLAMEKARQESSRVGKR